MSLEANAIADFDEVFSAYMTSTFGAHWRTMCHQSARIAASALHQRHPDLRIEVRRVELIAMMEGAPGFVHIGYADDPRVLDGKFPAHFAVAVGSGLYDPAFGQLRGAKTPLDLPDEAYYYSRFFFKHSVSPSSDGFRWSVAQMPSGNLRVGYKMQDQPLPQRADGKLMSAGQAKRHAQRVVRLWNS